MARWNAKKKRRNIFASRSTLKNLHTQQLNCSFVSFSFAVHLEFKFYVWKFMRDLNRSFGRPMIGIKKCRKPNSKQNIHYEIYMLEFDGIYFCIKVKMKPTTELIISIAMKRIKDTILNFVPKANGWITPVGIILHNIIFFLVCWAIVVAQGRLSIALSFEKC